MKNAPKFSEAFCSYEISARNLEFKGPKQLFHGFRICLFPGVDHALVKRKPVSVVVKHPHWDSAFLQYLVSGRSV